MQPSRLRSGCRAFFAVGLLFAVIFVAVYWVIPPQPYATLHVNEKCSLFRFSPDGGTLLTVADHQPYGYYFREGPIRVWDVGRGTERFSVAAGWSSIEPNMICFSPDGRLFAVHGYREDWEIKVWDARTGEETIVSRDGVRDILRFSPDGRFLVYKRGPGLEDLQFWDTQTRLVLSSTDGYDVPDIAFAADGRSCAAARRDTVDGPYRFTQVRWWTLNASEGLVLKRSHDIAASRIAFSPDLRKFAAVALNRRDIALWDMDTGDRQILEHFDGPEAYCVCLRFLQGGRILAAENRDGKIVFWDVASTPRKVGSFFGPDPDGFADDSRCGEPSPDGEHLAFPLDEQIPDAYNQSQRPPSAKAGTGVGARFVRISTLENAGRLVREGDGGHAFDSYVGADWPPPHYPSVTYSPDGKMLAVGDLIEPGREPFLSGVLPQRYDPFPRVEDRPVVRVWDVASRTHLMAFADCSVQFSPDGKVLAALHDDHVIDLWKLPFEKPLSQILMWTAGVWLVAVLVGWLCVKWKRKCGL